MRVLFASGIDGFCHRYAVLHWAEQLATQGIASTVRAHPDPRLAADLAAHELLILYRVPHSAWIDHLLGQARALGRATVFAIDDLIFDPTLTDAPPLKHMDAADRRLWHDGVARYRRTLLACDAFLTTSAPLVDAGRAAGKPTYLHRAGLAARELALGAAAMQPVDTTARTVARATERGAAVRLGYWSGTPTHDDDFATIIPVLTDLLARAPAVELVMGGHLEIEADLTRFGARVRRLPFVPWPELPNLIAATDVNLAPLAWSDPFVAAKGAVKYLEAAAVGVPTVASPTETFRDAIAPGRTGMLAADGRAWQAALDALVVDADLRRRLGAAARADVAARFDPVTQGRALAATLAAIVAHHGGRPAPAPRASAADELALARAFPGEVARVAREPQARPDVTMPPASAATPPLADGVVLAQRVRAIHAGLTRIDVHTITYGLPLHHTLELRLRRDDGSTVAHTTVAASLAPDRDWLALEFPPEAHSKGHCYTLELTARGTGPRNALACGTTAVPGPEGPFTSGGTPGSASLTLRAFAAEETPRTAERAAAAGV